MIYVPKPLVFNWKVNGKTIEEKFLSRLYKPSENDYEECDYIFQMYSVLSIFRFEELEKKYENHDSIISEFLSKNLLLGDSFLEAVYYLKTIYVSMIQFQQLCGDLQWFRDSESGMNVFLRRTNDIFEEPSNTKFCFYLLTGLPKALDTFKRKKDSTEIEKWLEETRKKIQNKAEEIVNNAEQMFKLGLWDDIETFLKKDCDGLILVSLKSKIKTFNEKADELIKTLNTLTEGYKKYVNKKNSCYALCIADDIKFYSLSGINDYDGTYDINSYFENNSQVDIKLIKDYLSPGSSFSYAPLADEVKCYGHWSDRGTRYFYSPTSLGDAIHNRFPKLEDRDVSCCERKIMAQKPNAHEYKFFIRKEPCFLCQPAMVSDSTKSIIVYVPSNDKAALRKIKVEYDSILNSYKNKDIP